MKTQTEYIALLKDNSEKLKNDFGITFMRLFGSVAKNKHTVGSDVDLFVKMPPVLYNAIAAAQFLEELLDCKVDLICDHDNLNPFSANKLKPMESIFSEQRELLLNMFTNIKKSITTLYEWN